MRLAATCQRIGIEVLQRDNRTQRTESFRPVFINHRTGRPYRATRFFEKFWRLHQERAGVRYRSIGQCRYTFASQMLTAGMPKGWVREQMGHTSDAMLNRKYGKYIKEDRRFDPAAMADALFRF